MFEPRLCGEYAVPRIAVIPFESGRQFGMQIGDGKGLQTASRDCGTQLLWFEISFFRRILLSSS